MPEKLVFIDVDLLHAFMVDVFRRLGVPEADARICADVLLASDLRGITSHGVQRLKMYYDRIVAKIQAPVTQITIVKETPTTARLDAGHGMGQVAAHRAMALAIQKAQAHGTGAVAVGNSSHYGIAGYYASMATQANLIGLSMTNARPSIAPTFSVEPMLGTNPIAIGIPTDEPFPFLLDMATSITQRGKIEVLARADKSTPEGWVIDTQGNLATDSRQILEQLLNGTASLLSLGGVGELLGGHKGYGLGTVVEIFSAALSESPFLKDLTLAKGYKLGHFFLALDPACFIELATFKHVAGGICRTLRAAKKAPGQARIYTAGEKEYYAEQERRTTGIPINTSIQQDLRHMDTELGLNYPFNF